jgi:hypothetical protein
VTEPSAIDSSEKLQPELAAELAQVLAPEVAEALVKWQADFRTAIVFDRWLVPGLSGAQVASVALSGQAGPRKVVMKVCPPGQTTGKEPARHQQALTNAPQKFATRHLVRQPIAPVKARRGWSVMFQEIAGGSMRNVRALSALRGRQLPALAASIVSSVLADWNPAPEVVGKTPVEFLLEHLGGRLDAGGPFDDLLGELTYTPGLDGANNPHWVHTPRQRTAPNIAAWIRDMDWGGPAGEHILAPYGKAHGDLHPDNILLPVGPEPEVGKYRLIDLSAYSAAAPLSRDPVHLLLSCIITEVSEMTEVQRHAVADFLIKPAVDAPAQLQVSGVCDISTHVVEACEAFARRMGMLDDWQDMQLLSLAGNALLFAMRTAVDPVLRGWAYELACDALGRFLTGRGIEAPMGDVPLLTFGTIPAAAVDVAEAIEALAAACGRWSGSSANVAVVDSDTLGDEAIARFVRLGWDLVVDMNPRTDIAGGWASATSDNDRVHRLRLPGQDLIFGRNSTLWLAAAGLSDVDPVNPIVDLRGWRRKYLRFVTGAFEALARHTAKPVTVTCFGAPGRAQLAVGEAAVDVLDDRAHLVVVSDTGAGDLADYAPDVVRCEPRALLRAVGPVSVVRDLARRPTLPSADGPKLVPGDVISRLGDTALLLHSEVGVENDSADAEIGAFYRGRLISWFELDLDLDVPRRVTDDFLVRVKDALEQRDTLRIMLGHYPGAGGTTVARRIAWRIKDTYPTVVVRTISDSAILAEAVAELAQLSALPVLLIIELVPESVLDRLFGTLRASSIPVVMLITARRIGRGYGRRGVDSEASPVYEGPAGQRGLRLGPMMRHDERVQMAQCFAQMAPERADALYALTGGSQAINVPFFYALTAFGDEFEGLPEYVMQFLTGLRDEEREILILTALVHRFSGTCLPAELFAPLLNVSRSSPVELAKLVSVSLLDLLAEDEPGAWRMTHSLIAEEVLRQLLTPTERRSSKDDWRAALPAWSLRLIEHASDVYGRYLPDDMELILGRLFTMRDDREPVELPSGTSTYTELLQSMSSPGRLDVMRHLVEAFPQEPHFWGHLGRLLSYDQNDYAGALAAADRAISLSPRDALLHHMRGMVFRNQIRNLIRQHPSRNESEAERESAVLALVEPARNAFREASALDDTSEYGPITLARMCVDVIEFGYRLSGEQTYAAFLTKPTAGIYRDLLEEAEESIDAAQEIRGGDHASFAAEEAELGVLRLYDDYQRLLQGWRNLLQRPDLYKPPIRRRLARAYRNRHGSWRKASPRDVRQAVELLEENLRDDPRDIASLLEWLWAARFIPVSVDRAADLVETWASTENDRDAFYYDYVLACLRVLKGQDSAIPEYHRKLERSKERSSFFGNRRFSYEWLGEEAELGRIIHHTDLRDWDRSGDEPPPSILARVTGRVNKITGPASGIIDLGRGIEAFFVPQRSGLHRGIDENRRVSALLSFRYDGPQAWSVRPE